MCVCVLMSLTIIRMIDKGGGFPMLIGHASSGLANGTIFLQCLWCGLRAMRLCGLATHIAATLYRDYSTVVVNKSLPTLTLQ